MDKKYAYVTALSNDSYLPGTMGLIKSLKHTKTKYDLIIMIPENKADELIDAMANYGVLDFDGVSYKVVKDVLVPSEIEGQTHYWSNTFFKLRAAELTCFDKIILIDSDMLVMNNIDHLFEKPTFSAVVAGKCRVPEWVDLNSGLMVLKPDDRLYCQLEQAISPTIRNRFSKNLNVGDQDVFHYVFPEWKDHPELNLHEKYNVFWSDIPVFCEKYSSRFSDINVVHFIGSTKPWHYPTKYWMRLLYGLLRSKCLSGGGIWKIISWRKYRLLCEK